jgi:predicted DNA-binding transcriptional regulator YafY
MSVWCLDKKEWRSFRIANVISAKAKDENSI